MPDRIEYFVLAMTRALPLIAPEILIRERAIELMKDAASVGRSSLTPWAFGSGGILTDNVQGKSKKTS